MNYLAKAIKTAVKANVWNQVKSWFHSDFRSSEDRKNWVRSVLEEMIVSSKVEGRTEIVEDDPEFTEISLVDYIKSSHGIFSDPLRNHPQGLCVPSFSKDGRHVVSSVIHYYPNVIANCLALNLLRSKKIARYYVQFIVEHERQHARQDPEIMSSLHDAKMDKLLGLSQIWEQFERYQHRPEEVDANRAALRAVIKSIREAKNS